MTQRQIDALNQKAQKQQKKQQQAQEREQDLRGRAAQAEGKRRAKLLRRAEKQQIRANAPSAPPGRSTTRSGSASAAAAATTGSMTGSPPSPDGSSPETPCGRRA